MDYRKRIQQIHGLYLTGDITYDEAKEEIASLESVHKRLKVNLKERVQKTVNAQCQKEKTTLFKMN